jgi:hypothetical protein
MASLKTTTDMVDGGGGGPKDVVIPNYSPTHASFKMNGYWIGKAAIE